MFRRLLVVLFLISGAAWMLVGTAPPAHGSTGDTVRRLDVSYAVQRDGTVDVRYRLDWDFGRKGAHGISLSLVTTEKWEDDPLKEAVYEIDDLAVSSPSGVPTDLETHQSSRSLELRIGDPNTALDVDHASYLVTYTISGAMRTVGGSPQLYWDVTSYDFPDIDDFTITVTGPSDVPRARCLQGSVECSTKINSDGAVLTGKDVESGDTLTAVAEFEPGSVDHAKPHLVERELYSPALTKLNETVTVGADGVVHARQKLRVKTTPKNSEVVWEVPERRSLSWSKDRLFEVSDVSVTLDGRALPIVQEHRATGQSAQHLEITAELPEGAEQSETVDLVAEYSVTGAVVSDGQGPASFIWPISTIDSRDYDVATTETVNWKLPGPVSRIDCRYRLKLGEADDDCYIRDQLSSADAVATFNRSDEDGSGPLQWVIIEFDPSGLGQIIPPTAWSQTARGLTIAGVVIGSVLIFPVLGMLVARIRVGTARDERYADVAPGTIGSNKNVTAEPLDGPIPVRFEPPEADLLQVGIALERKVTKSQLAATLINMAVNGAVGLKARPLTMWQLDGDKLTSSFERSLFERVAAADSSAEPLSTADKTAMARQVQGQIKQAKHQADLIRRIPLRGASMIVWGLPPVLAIAGGATATMITGWIHWLTIGLGVGALLVGGIIVGVARHRYARTAKATALVEQAVGFRRYLRTAEASQLNAEADADIYRRYLPWAVLFDDVDRWTAVCRQLAETGKVAAPDAGFIAGLGSVDHLGHELRGMTQAVRTSPPSSGSSGGSGGSSGFSGGASGGGGGGGTSAHSW